MRILDRYILWNFIKNYVISFMVLIGLYIVLDMVFNFDELAEVQNRGGAGGVESAVSLLKGLVDYYFYQSFLIFAHLSGIIPLVAAAFTLIRMQRFNELTASLAAGVPLLRTAMPIVLAAVVLNALLVVDQEILIPRMIPKLTRKHDEVQQVGVRTYAIPSMQDEQNGILRASRYHPASATELPFMEYFDVIQRDEEGNAVAHVSADRADWDHANRRWRLTRGTLVTGLQPGSELKRTPCPFYESNVTPDEVSLYHSSGYTELLSTPRINQLLARPKSYGMIDLLRVKHARLTQWIVNIVMLLLAVPSVLSRDPGRIRMGIMQCAVLCGACMTAIFISQQVAGTPPAGTQWMDRWPAIMAWIPILIFGPIAVWLLDRIKT
ncbi:MAG TPA: LptF/LptG family permease [Tepidisphaeraceae bacterium]|jgi:lipopolysaccharide export system permease protein